MRSSTINKNPSIALRIAVVCCLALSMFIIASCAPKQNTEAVASETENEALVIYAQDGDYLFVDLETETLFFPTLTEAVITNNTGQEMPLENLAVGDIVTITGDGAMTMSYPALYPGITRVQIDSRGNMDDVNNYNDALQVIFPPISDSDVPVGWLDYSTSVGDIMLALNPYSYQGFVNANSEVTERQLDDSYVDDSGVVSELVGDARFKGTIQATAGFTSDFQSVTVDRVPLTQLEEDRLHVDLTAPQESVSTTVVGNGELSLTIEPGYVYILNMVFANGEAHYAFATLNY